MLLRASVPTVLQGRLPFTGYGKSITDVLKAADEAAEYTPDSWRLDRYEWQRLFVPDEIQRGFPRYELIKDNSYFAYRAFTEVSMVLWVKNLGQASYAIPLPDRWPNVPLAHIGGQVHIVRPSVFKELDRLRLNGLHFDRRRMSVIIPFRENVEGRDVSHERVRRKYCHMYMGIPQYWNQQLDGGYYFKPAPRFESKLAHVSDYYLFTKLIYGVPTS